MSKGPGGACVRRRGGGRLCHGTMASPSLQNVNGRPLIITAVNILIVYGRRLEKLVDDLRLWITRNKWLDTNFGELCYILCSIQNNGEWNRNQSKRIGPTSKVSTKPQYLATEHLNNVLRVHYVRRKRTNDSKTYCDEVVGKVPTEKYWLSLDA